MNIGIIGAGHIGAELYGRARARGWKVDLVLKRSGVYSDLSARVDDSRNFRRHLNGLDVAFLAIPTLDDGRTAYGYIKMLLSRGIPVVTCEKGALSNYFPDLEGSLDRIGYSATVGGGTKMLHFARQRAGPQTREIHAVINGTLNYLFDGVSSGRTIEEVVDEAKKLGYAEPGAKTELEVINTEATRDVPMKTAILFNVLGLSSRKIRAKEIRVREMSKAKLDELLAGVQGRRYIVSIARERRKEDVVGGFSLEAGDWYISAGFKRVDRNPLFDRMIPAGVNNAILLSEGKDGAYILSGPGAGAGPTVSSMIWDAENLIK